MGKSGQSHRERGRRTDERSDSMSPTSESEKFEDLTYIYADTDQLEPYTENYQYADEDEDDI
jgi:hypothetical protein